MVLLFRLRRFLLASDQMIVLLGPTYFGRLWCVFELASVCRLHEARLFDHLTMLCVDWPSVLSPLKATALSPEELSWLAEFRCEDAECLRPIDRANILAAVRRQWGSVGAFDQFVRERIPAVLAEGKRRYGHRVVTEAVRTFELAFGE